MSEDCCGKCVYFKDDAMNPGGICRLNPPVVFERGTNSHGDRLYTSRYPVVFAHHWCGKFDSGLTVILDEVSLENRIQRLEMLIERQYKEELNIPKYLTPPYEITCNTTYQSPPQFTYTTDGDKL